MKKFLIAISALTVLGGLAAVPAHASPQDDLKNFRAYFFKKFPGVKLQDFGNGIYSIDATRRFEWEEMEEFPAYEEGLEKGEALFKKYGLAKCFKNGGKGIKQNYPYFDSKSGKVRTLEQDINACVVKNGHKKLKWKKGDMPAIGAYMAYTSRGKKQNVVIPNNKAALAAYNRGKVNFYAKRGQLNFACADCHVYNSGMMARGNLLSPALGHTSHFPVWRRKWAKGKGGTAGFGTIQRRYGGCNKQVRAKPLKAQSAEYNALEYFHTFMSNGIKLNGPAIRQ
jgi:sulfur-oxidizing protein SoxA